ncbi:hypothetical protein [Nitrincola alkalilacustris]|uniref:hypothetical protein n=1 Tax=Nitrincola alkalilacustris TaxID=1571224 RepID=UPI00124E9296|nr:hypothetical protein [Nitrincola alkalilacustris]
MSDRKEPDLNLAALKVPPPEPEPPVLKPMGRHGSKQRGGWLRTFLVSVTLLFLMAATAGLAYVGNDMRMTLIEQQRTLNQSQARIAELEELLAMADDNTQQTGQTLAQRITELESKGLENYEYFHTEIIRLWEQSGSIDEEAFAEQGQQLIQQSEVLDALSQQVASLEEITAMSQRLSTLEERLTVLATLEQQVNSIQESSGSLLPEVESRLDSLSASVDEGVNALQQELSSTQGSIASLEQRLGENAFLLSTEQEQRERLQRELNARIDQVAALPRGDTSGLASRVNSAEQAINAIDGFRRQTGQDIQQLRQILNELQLRVQQLQN